MLYDSVSHFQRRIIVTARCKHIFHTHTWNIAYLPVFNRETNPSYARAQQVISMYLAGSERKHTDVMSYAYTNQLIDCTPNLPDYTQHRRSSVIESPGWDLYFISGARWQTGFWTQFKTLIKRSFLLNRKSMYPKISLLMAVAITIFVSVAWAQLPITEAAINNRMSFVSIFIVWWFYS